MNHRKKNEEKPRPDRKVIVLKRIMAGIGTEVAEPYSAKNKENKVPYRRMVGDVALARQRYFRQCAGLPADPPPAQGASVLLVNRPHGGGRHIIGLDDVYDRLVRELSPLGIPVRLYLPRSEHLADQASVFASANVLVVPHGAANTNFAFLPHNATVFVVHAIGHRYILDLDHAQALPTPTYNVTLIPIRCKSKKRLRFVGFDRLFFSIFCSHC